MNRTSAEGLVLAKIVTYLKCEKCLDTYFFE